MLESLELQVFPSAYNCVSWSEDGEIAVATGEYVHILTPKISSKREATGTASNFSSTDWHRTRFRANVFTINEWPIMFPQPRDHFSIGAEQSLSTVVGVAWSPPGLAKYRRSVLAVLTSNMVLSIYAPASTLGKWTRITIVNKALENFFRESIENNTLTTRFQTFFRRDIEDKTPRTCKTNIRSFSWTPPLKIPAQNQLYPGPESRWGISLLGVTNDDNDLVFLQFQLPSPQQGSLETLHVEAVCAVPLPNLTGYEQALRSGSMLFSAVQSQIRTLSLASGPWTYVSRENEINGEGPLSATVNMAAIQGTKLRVVKLSVGLEQRTCDLDKELRYNLTFNATENTAFPVARMVGFPFTGPIQWAHKVEPARITMAVGTVTGLSLLDLPEHAYRGDDSEDSDTHAFYYPMHVDSDNDITPTRAPRLERTSGMTIAIDPESETSILHFGSVGGYAAIKPLTGTDAPSRAPWNDQVDDIRERFDIDRDLGGLAVSRIWGLASMQGLITAVVTLHPGDMVEYRTNAEDRLTIVFFTANGQPANPDYVPFLRQSPTDSMQFMRERRDVVLQYILGNHVGTKNTLSPRVLYAAACCAIVQSQNAEIITNAQGVLKRLAAINGVDVADEIAKCSAPGSTIEAKPADILNATGGDIFEKCEVCEAGIVWYSAQEAQCATGHVFVRCNLTFLAIQDPGISKFCSKCENEYFDEDLISDDARSDIQRACKSLSEVFDTCVYCNGKFRS
ncbi:transcription factor IIIC subunit delta N-term-domain-containing protein [Aspergillus varians]